MAGFVRIRQVESRLNLSFCRTLRLSSDRRDLIPPPKANTVPALKINIILLWLSSYKASEINKIEDFLHKIRSLTERDSDMRVLII
jgi:hypothetical protein